MNKAVIILMLSLSIWIQCSCSQTLYPKNKGDQKKIEKPVLVKSDVSEGLVDWSKKLTLAELISILSSIAATISTILTYLLLKETQRTLNLGAKVADRDSKRLEAEMVSLIYRNFRDTYMSMLNDKIGVKALASAHGKKAEEVRVNMHVSFLINNVHEMYNLYQSGFVADDIWENFCIDIEEFFYMPFIEKRWEEVQTYYPKRFQLFVSALKSKRSK